MIISLSMWVCHDFHKFHINCIHIPTTLLYNLARDWPAVTAKTRNYYRSEIITVFAFASCPYTYHMAVHTLDRQADGRHNSTAEADGQGRRPR